MKHCVLIVLVCIAHNRLGSGALLDLKAKLSIDRPSVNSIYNLYENWNNTRASLMLRLITKLLRKKHLLLILD